MIKAEEPERLVAYLTLQRIHEDEFVYGGEVCIRLHCKRHMPAHQIPSAFVVMEQVRAPILALCRFRVSEVATDDDVSVSSVMHKWRACTLHNC